MRNVVLPEITEIRRESERNFGGAFASDEEAFADAFMHGEDHEEDCVWLEFLGGLTDEQLFSLFLPVCAGLIAGDVRYRHQQLHRRLNTFDFTRPHGLTAQYCRLMYSMNSRRPIAA